MLRAFKKNFKNLITIETNDIWDLLQIMGNKMVRKANETRLVTNW